jgi:hypothetical protein
LNIKTKAGEEYFKFCFYVSTEAAANENLYGLISRAICIHYHLPERAMTLKLFDSEYSASLPFMTFAASCTERCPKSQAGNIMWAVADERNSMSASAYLQQGIRGRGAMGYWPRVTSVKLIKVSWIKKGL